MALRRFLNIWIKLLASLALVLGMSSAAHAQALNNVLINHRASALNDGAVEDTIDFTFSPGAGADRVVVAIVYHEYNKGTDIQLNDLRLNGVGGRIIGRATNTRTRNTKDNRMTVALFSESDLGSGNATVQLRYGGNTFSSTNANGMGASVYLASFSGIDQGRLSGTTAFNNGCIGSGNPPGGTGGGAVQLPTSTALPRDVVIAGIGVGADNAGYTFPNNPLISSTDFATVTGPGFAFGRIVYVNDTTANVVFRDQVGISTGCNNRPITTQFVLRAAPLTAVDDVVQVASGPAAQPGIANVLDANPTSPDILNNNPAPISDVVITVTDPADSISGGPVPTLDPVTGDISLPANVPPGTYTITYEVCQRGAEWNCDTATATITVTGTVQADNDSVADVDGALGAADVLNVLEGDTVGGGPATTANVTLRVATPAVAINGGNVPVLDPADGLIDVPAQTPAGTYTIEYEICETAVPSNCGTATATIIVRAATVVAVDDDATITAGAGGQADVLNVLTGDTVNGNPATLGNVTLAIAPGATLPAELRFDPATGNVSVNPGSAPGTYGFDYQICETLNPANCQIATVSVTIDAPDVTAPIITGPVGGPGDTSVAIAINEGIVAVGVFTSNEGITWSLGGVDAGLFSIDAGGNLVFNAPPDFDAPTDADGNNIYEIVVTATDAAGNSTTQTVRVTVLDVDGTGPIIGDGTGAREITLDEGIAAVATLTANEPVTWAISGGPDAGDLIIDPATGALTFVAAPDFEAPVDSNGDNVYVVVVTATDTVGNTTTETVTVIIRDIDDTSPVISRPVDPDSGRAEFTINEGDTPVATLTANEPVTWSISNGADAALFTIDPATGALTFNQAPDFEAPSDGNADNDYLLTVTATDSAGNATTIDALVRVLDLADDVPVITGPSGGPGAGSSEVTVNEGLRPITDFVADVAVAWEIIGGVDAFSLTIDPATGALSFVIDSNFERPVDADGNNRYEVTIRAVDANGNFAVQQVTVLVADVDEIAERIDAISDVLRGDLRSYALRSLGSMLAFNETLMSAAREDFCEPANARDPIQGSFNLNQDRQDGQIAYNQVRQDCTRGWRMRVNGGAVIAGERGDWTTRGFGAVQIEKRVEDDLTLGLGVMGSFADDQLASFAQSNIYDHSLQLNGYVQVDVTDTLRAAGFAAIGKAWYDFDLADDGLELRGEMTGTRFALGAMVSGDLVFGRFVVTPDVALAWAVEDLGSARLAAELEGVSRDNILFRVGSVDTTRLSIPVNLRYTMGNLLTPDSRLSEFSISPGLLCEDIAINGSNLTCGYQLGARIARTRGTRSFAFVDYNFEDVGSVERHIGAVGVGYRFGRDRNLEVTLEGNHGVALGLNADTRALLSVRVKQ